MQAFAGLSLLAIGIVTLTVGVRLLLVWRRTRQLPELAFGIGFVSGSLGSALAQIGQRLLWKDAGAVATALNAACFTLQVVGTIFLFVVIWRVFRPNRLWAQNLCWTAAVVLGVSLGLRLESGELAEARIETSGMLVFFASRLFLFAWSSFESFRYHAMLKRRLALGLADPLAAQQIFFWGLAGVATWGVMAVITGTIFVLHRHPVEYGPSMGAITALCLVLSVTMWWAFFPPAFMRRRTTAPAS